jgi:hypothetical protein
MTASYRILRIANKRIKTPCHGCVHFSGNIWLIESLNSLVAIATGYGLDDREVEVRVPVGQHFLFLTSSIPALEPKWLFGLTYYYYLHRQSGRIS